MYLCLGKVYDKNGVVRSGEEGRKVWSEHFKEVLQGGKESPTGCMSQGRVDGCLG